jgi:hypothetical protein
MPEPFSLKLQVVAGKADERRQFFSGENASKIVAGNNVCKCKCVMGLGRANEISDC